ncbi:MAG: serine protease [Hyphomicrobiaceae bacterium]
MFSKRASKTVWLALGWLVIIVGLSACAQVPAPSLDTAAAESPDGNALKPRKPLPKTVASASPSDRRIVGGKETDIRSHPWQVAVRVTQNNQSFQCGGTLVAQTWVLTAAHCFDDNSTTGDIQVKMGVNDPAANGKWTKVARLVRHVRYDAKTNENDLALIKLSRPGAGRVIPMAGARHTVPARQTLEVTGWGAIKEDGQSSRKLVKANVPYVTNEVCNHPKSYDGTIKKGMLCAGKEKGGVDACQGDSGGPLVWRTTDGPVLVGVVSFGIGCARRLKYGVYTRVSTYRSWIEQVMAANPV